MSVVSNIRSSLNSQSSVLSTAGSSTQTLNLANSLIHDFIDLVVSAWEAICNIAGGAVDFVLEFWDNIVGATLGSAIEAVKSVITIIVNTIVDLIWNYVFTPILPSFNYSPVPSDFSNVFSISSTDTFLQITSQTSDNQTFDPNLNLQGSDSQMVSFQNIGASLGILDILTPIGETHLISMVLNALITRIMQHVSDLFLGSSDSEAQSELDFINQNIGTGSYSNSIEGSNSGNNPSIQSYGDVNPNIGYEGQIQINPNRLTGGLFDLPYYEKTAIIGFGDMLSDGGKITKILKTTILLYLADEIVKALQSLLLTGEEFLEHPYYFSNMGLYMEAAYNQALNLRDNPQNYKESAMVAASYISASEMTIEFFNIGTRYISLSTDWSLAFDATNTILSWNYFTTSLNYANFKSLQDTGTTPDFANLPIDAFLYTMQGASLVLSNIASFFSLSLKGVLPSSEYPIMSQEAGIFAVIASLFSLAVMIMKIGLTPITDHLEQILSMFFLFVGGLNTILKILNVIIIDSSTDKEMIGKINIIATGLSEVQIFLYIGQFYISSIDIKSNNW